MRIQFQFFRFPFLLLRVNGWVFLLILSQFLITSRPNSNQIRRCSKKYKFSHSFNVGSLIRLWLCRPQGRQKKSTKTTVALRRKVDALSATFWRNAAWFHVAVVNSGRTMPQEYKGLVFYLQMGRHSAPLHKPAVTAKTPDLVRTGLSGCLCN